MKRLMQSLLMATKKLRICTTQCMGMGRVLLNQVEAHACHALGGYLERERKTGVLVYNRLFTVEKLEWVAFCLNHVLEKVDGKKMKLVDVILEPDNSGCDAMMREYRVILYLNQLFLNNTHCFLSFVRCCK